MVRTPGTHAHLPLKLLTFLVFFLVMGGVVISGCTMPSIRSTKGGNSSSPQTTPSISGTAPDAWQTPVQDHTDSSTVPRKGHLNVSIGNYSARQPVSVFIDNTSAGTVSRGAPLNLEVGVGRHTVRVCEGGSCVTEDVLVISASPAIIDFGERLNKKGATGQLRVSIGGFNAELPVLVDGAPVGNVSMSEPLDMVLAEGSHRVQVCVGVICENQTVVIKFAQPVFIDFGEQLKKDVEVTKPTIRMVDTQEKGDSVTVTVEFINPGKKDLTMSATLQVTYSYVDSTTHWRKNAFKQGTVSAPVKAGTRIKKNLVLYLTGGSAYMSEIPVILETSLQ